MVTENHLVPFFNPACCSFEVNILLLNNLLNNIKVNNLTKQCDLGKTIFLYITMSQVLSKVYQIQFTSVWLP